MDTVPEAIREHMAKQLRPSVVLAVAWRLLTELYRRHGATHELRLLRAHPGISVAGQLKLFVNPPAGHLSHCIHLVLNLGGPTGTFEVRAPGRRAEAGEFFWPSLTADPATVVDRIEALLGLRAPPKLPASTPSVVAMRVMSEVLTASLMDRRELLLEPAWFDWSGGLRVYRWSSHFGVDAQALQKRLDQGAADWQAIYLSVSGLFRLCRELEQDAPGDGLLFDLQSGTLLVTEGGAVREKIDLMAAFIGKGRRIEPIAASALVALRRGL